MLNYIEKGLVGKRKIWQKEFISGEIYWIRYADLIGKIVFESSGSTKFRDAEALVIKRKQSVKEGSSLRLLSGLPIIPLMSLYRNMRSGLRGRKALGNLKYTSSSN
ncbi:MAG: hypothetical protein HS132_01355 [Planctomycetia bacterium]|nr:hypothetical protein [Planctomycetia bacterium]